MSRRTQQLFSLSLLDLLTSALGAIIFLFIITPKGGASASEDRQAMVFFDTTLMKIHGELPDSLLGKLEGDTLQVVLMAYQEDPQAEELVRAEAKKRAAERAKARAEAAEAAAKAKAKAKAAALAKAEAKKGPPRKPVAETPKPKPSPTPKPEKKPEPTKPTPKPKPKATKPSYTGNGPSVPANLSIEVNWKDKGDNIDLFVCKGGDCVYGGKKKNKKVGNWDSGKSRNRIFGNDLRTNQEAVRQFDKIIPGEYKIYAQLKGSKENRTSVDINGLIYTKDPETQKERGEAFSETIALSEGRVHIATMILEADGTYVLRRP